MTTSTMTTTMQWHYAMNGICTEKMNGIRTKKMNGIHTWKMRMGTHMREESPPPVDRKSSPVSSPMRPPSPSSFPKSNILSDYITLRPAENLNIKMIGSSQGQ